MFSFFQSRPSQKTIVVVSCEAGLVHAGVVSVSPDKKPRVKYYTQVTLSSSHFSQHKALLQALDTVIQNIAHHHKASFDKVFCLLSYPWVETSAESFVRDEEAPFDFSEREAKEILHRHKKETEKKYLHTKGEEPVSLEHSITSLSANGYHAKKISHSNIRRIELSTYVSVCSKSFLQETQNHFAKLSSKTPVFSSSSIAEFSITRDVLHHVSDFLLVRVGEFFTEVFLVQDGRLVSLDHSLVGTSCISSGLSSQDKTLLLGELGVWSRGHFNPSKSSRLAGALSQARETWGGVFNTLLQKISKEHHVLPHTSIVITSSTHFPWIQETLHDDRNSTLLISHKKPHAILFEGDLLEPIISSSVEYPDPIFLIHSAFIIERFLES